MQGPGGEQDRGLGATLMGGGAAGWAAHHAGGGVLGTVGGAVAGAIGANVLEHQFDKYAFPIPASKIAPGRN